MRTRDEVAADKLRGGFYTPPSLVRVCLDRIASLNGYRDSITILEPSIGDGAFLRGVAEHRLASQVSKLVGLEVIQAEAAKSRSAAREVPFSTSIANVSAIAWAVESNEWFDAVVGNPPFVRYQFVPQEDIESARKLADRLGLSFYGVSNLWIPVLIGALAHLRPSGLMAMVIPTEIFTGISAGVVREWLLTNFTDLRIDLFEPGSFPSVLQEVIVLSGRRAEPKDGCPPEARRVKFVERKGARQTIRWSHAIPPEPGNWTRYLLEPPQLEALSEALALPQVCAFGSVAKLEVAIVTGANKFFSVSQDEVDEYGLRPWTLPLLPRMRHARGLVYRPLDHRQTVRAGAKAWLLDFGESRPGPLPGSGAYRYLEDGEQRGLHLRYKTSIRSPWYRVPLVGPGKLMMSKRSHRFPRLVLNAAGVFTTDTIYQGSMLPGHEAWEKALVAGFHNSLTLLTAELEGRSFGGGVLELVPSETARLSVPLLDGISGELQRLDQIARECATGDGAEERLVETTDAILQQYLPGYTRGLAVRLRVARHALLKRRLSRN